MSRTRPTSHKARHRHKWLCTPFAGLSAVALLTIASGIATDGARSKAFFLVGAASSAGASTLRKRSDILNLKWENKQHRDSAAAALQRVNSLEEQQRQIVEDVVIRKIEDIEKQLLIKLENTQQEIKLSSSAQLEAIEAVRTKSLHDREIIKQKLLNQFQRLNGQLQIPFEETKGSCKNWRKRKRKQNVRLKSTRNSSVRQKSKKS